MSKFQQLDLLDYPIDEALGVYMLRLHIHTALALNADRVVWRPTPKTIKVYIGTSDDLPIIPKRDEDAEDPWPISFVEEDVVKLTGLSASSAGRLEVFVKDARVPILVQKRAECIVLDIEKHQRIVLSFPLSRPSKTGYRKAHGFDFDRRKVYYYTPWRGPGILESLIHWSERRAVRRFNARWAKMKKEKSGFRLAEFMPGQKGKIS